MQYLILEGHSAFQLEKAVNDSLQEGFVPIGSVAVSAEPGSSDYFYQAVCKFEDRHEV